MKIIERIKSYQGLHLDHTHEISLSETTCKAIADIVFDNYARRTELLSFTRPLASDVNGFRDLVDSSDAISAPATVRTPGQEGCRNTSQEPLCRCELWWATAMPP